MVEVNVEPMPGEDVVVSVGVNSTVGVRVIVGLAVMDGISVGGTAVTVDGTGADPQAVSRRAAMNNRVIFKVYHLS
jgi:hypothetical protein